MTSSLTQSVWSASRASCAVRTASRAVKQPAVFGSTSTPLAAMTSSTEPWAAASMRRIATVTSSVREASIASPSVCMRVKPPVPSSRRECSSRPAMISGPVIRPASP